MCVCAAGPHGQQVGFQSGSRYGRTDPDAAPMGPDDRLQRRFYANGRYGKRASGVSSVSGPALVSPEYQLLDGTGPGRTLGLGSGCPDATEQCSGCRLLHRALHRGRGLAGRVPLHGRHQSLQMCPKVRIQGLLLISNHFEFLQLLDFASENYRRCFPLCSRKEGEDIPAALQDASSSVVTGNPLN